MTRLPKYLNSQERLSLKSEKRIKNVKRTGRNFKSKTVTGPTIRAAVSSRPVKEETDEGTVRLQKQHLL